jgi:serine/threonine protein kinase
MGVVFAARHLALDERVAIKVLAPAANGHQEALARLKREARILARVRNEHVVRVIDLGQLEDGAPFMVMEYLTGRDLGSLLEEQGRLGVETAVSYVLQALVALAAAHVNGVVHRDLKPENLFCTPGEGGGWTIKVLDFGISRLERPGQGSAAASMTGPSAVMGTPLYMSPEQLRDARGVDARSDIWSIGVVLYELVTGVAPFSGVSLGDIAIKIATEPAPPLTFVDPSLATGLEAVLSRCLHKERDQRFSSVVELARALQPFAPADGGRLVERVERLAAEPPLQLVDDDKPALPEDQVFGSLAPPMVAPASRPAPPATAREAGRPNRARLLLALPGILLLAAAWRLATSRDSKPPVISAAAVLEQRPPAGASIITTTALPPEVPQRTSEPSAATAQTAELAKNLRAASSSRSVPASKGHCNPPYTVDPQGRKKFRHECFTERITR